MGTEGLNCFKLRKKIDAGMEGWVVGGKGRVGDCYANAICSSSTHCSPGIHKHDVDDDYKDESWNENGRNHNQSNLTNRKQN